MNKGDLVRGLLSLDIDGVLTNGTVSLDAAGDERKLLSYRDIDAVYRARREGLAVALLTAEDTPVAHSIGGRLQVDRFVAGRREKGLVLQELARELGLGMDSVCYIGDSRKDIGALELAGLGLTPADAEVTAQAAADEVLTRLGGDGAVAEGLELFLSFLDGEDDPENARAEESVERLQREIRELSSVLGGLEESGLSDIMAAGRLLRETLEGGGSIYTFGNGGSAADAQHLAAEIMGFYRGSLGSGRAIALTADTALLTALANDAGYDEVFARQIALHARLHDAAVAFTTSGRSENIVRGLAMAQEKGLRRVLVTGAAAPANVPADVRVAVPSADTQRIQEVHGLVVHLLCELARGE